jgi:hypothetical protein
MCGDSGTRYNFLGDFDVPIIALLKSLSKCSSSLMNKTSTLEIKWGVIQNPVTHTARIPLMAVHCGKFPSGVQNLNLLLHRPFCETILPRLLGLAGEQSSRRIFQSPGYFLG